MTWLTKCTVQKNLFFLKINLFIYFWLCWVFVSVRGLSPVAASGGHSSLQCAEESILETSFPSTPLDYCTGSLLMGYLSTSVAFFFLWITEALISISPLGIFLKEISLFFPHFPQVCIGYSIVQLIIVLWPDERFFICSFVRFFSWFRETIWITFSSPKEKWTLIKWTLIKVRKRELEGGKFIYYLPWHFSLPLKNKNLLEWRILK